MPDREPAPVSTVDSPAPEKPARRRGRPAKSAVETTPQPPLEVCVTAEAESPSPRRRSRGRKTSAPASSPQEGSPASIQATTGNGKSSGGQSLREADTVLQDARQQAACVRQHLRDAEHELETAREYLQTTKRQSKDARLEFQEAERLVQEARRRATRVQQCVPEIEQDLNTSRQLAANARQEMEQVAQQCQTARQEWSEMSQRLVETRRRLAEAQQQVQEFRRQIDEARRQKEEVVAAALEFQQPAAVAVVAPEGSPASEIPEGQDVELTYGLVRQESRQQRLLRYLSDAWAVEKSLVGTLETMAREVIDPALASLFEEHREVTRQQQEALEGRIRALGGKPSGGKGFFQRMIGGVWDSLHRSEDAYDRTTQDLMKGYATEHFEMAMYEALRTYASAIGDQESAQLAERLLLQEQEAADKLWPLIDPTACRPARAAQTETAEVGR